MDSESGRTDHTLPNDRAAPREAARTDGAETERGEYRRRWYPLDNTARIFPPILSKRFTTLFRISVRLTSAVRVGALERALERTWERIPIFRVHVRRGIFWHYLEECPAGVVKGDGGTPCMDRPRFGDRRPLVTVRARGRRIAVEASHIVTDGIGALQFLRALIAAYYREIAGATPHFLSEARRLAVLVPGDDADPREGEYASRRFFRRRLPDPVEYSPAWHAGGLRLPTGSYRVTVARYPVAALKDIARRFTVTITDLLLAVFIQALQHCYYTSVQPRHRRRPIRVLVPVDMRPSTSSKTMRNFFVYALVEIDQRLGRYELDEIARNVHHQLRAKLDPRDLRRHISRNVRAERNIFIRIIPMAVKDLILTVAHRLQGEAANTASFSNVGRVELPSEAASLVESFDFLPPPSPITGVNMTLISTGDTASIGFGSMRAQQDVEQRVVESLSRLGARGVLRTNWRR